jgi:hypothetical protein
MKAYRNSIKPHWDNIKDITDEIHDIFSNDVNKANAIRMVSEELLENIIKYGDLSNEKSPPTISIDSNKDTILIKTTNMIKSKNNADELIKHINLTLSRTDYQKIYLERLKDIRKSKKREKTMLGIYRIVYEGMFRLNYDLEGDLLTITAVRNFKE